MIAIKIVGLIICALVIQMVSASLSYAAGMRRVTDTRSDYGFIVGLGALLAAFIAGTVVG